MGLHERSSPVLGLLPATAEPRRGFCTLQLRLQPAGRLWAGCGHAKARLQLGCASSGVFSPPNSNTKQAF